MNKTETFSKKLKPNETKKRQTQTVKKTQPVMNNAQVEATSAQKIKSKKKSKTVATLPKKNTQIKRRRQYKNQLAPQYLSTLDGPVISQTDLGHDGILQSGKTPKLSSSRGSVKIIPLGGMREIGKNMTAFEYGNDLIVIDCGVAFPDADLPGIDSIIPDFSYLRQNRHKLRAMFITHGHEDHIGAITYFCREFNIPIYGNRLTIKLIENKLNSRYLDKPIRAHLNTVNSGETIKVGAFKIEFIHVNHSIADANAFAIYTPVGTIFHSGDFKVDFTPIHGSPIDLQRIAQIGASGVLAFLCESTNAERPGFSSSESKVGETLENLFEQADGRIFVATFASNIFRLQQIITAAEKNQRKVALLGTSMLNVFAAANSLGYIDIKDDTLIEANDIDEYEANKILIITTGSQGESLAALTRMAFSEHKRVEILAGDTVILSSSAIPGNEKAIDKVINELYKRGANVIYEALGDIHVSGHAYQDELKLLHQLVKPKYFIPCHGEYRHLIRHAEHAHAMGTPWEQIFLLNNGDVLELKEKSCGITSFSPCSGILIDGSGMGDVDQFVLNDRKLLADDGLLSSFMVIDKKNNRLIGQPDVQARGFIFESETQEILKICRKKIEQFIKRSENNQKPLKSVIESGALETALRNLCFEKTKRRPMILISVIETNT